MISAKKGKKELKSDHKSGLRKKIFTGTSNIKKKFQKASVPFKTVRKYGSGVLYVGRLPFGFFEKELQNYFSQFGEVSRVKVSRSYKTGRSKGFGFVEFKDEDVADVAQETLNNVILFDRIVKCSRIDDAKKYIVFRGPRISEEDFPLKRQRRRKILQHNKEKVEAAAKKSTRNILNKLRRVNNRLKKVGINYKALAFKPGTEEEEPIIENMMEETVPKKMTMKKKKKPVVTKLFRDSMMFHARMWKVKKLAAKSRKLK